jgi:hypothetical protein
MIIYESFQEFQYETSLNEGMVKNDIGDSSNSYKDDINNANLLKNKTLTTFYKKQSF